MKDVNGTISANGKEYNLVFNLNVMERVQEEYGSIAEWGKLTDGANGEPNIKAVKFGFREMLNEGIDIANEENGTHEPLLTLKQVGRILTDVGLDGVTRKMNETVVESTQSTEKNA